MAQRDVVSVPHLGTFAQKNSIVRLSLSQEWYDHLVGYSYAYEAYNRHGDGLGASNWNDEYFTKGYGYVDGL